MLWVVHQVWCTLNQLVVKICYHSKAACQIGWTARMFTFQLLTRKQWKHKQIIFWIVWTFSILVQSVELRSSHSCVCIYSGCVTAVVQPTSPLLRNVHSSAQMCVQQSGLQQTDSSEHLDCHLCQSVHPSQVLHQPPVVIDCSFLNVLITPCMYNCVWSRSSHLHIDHRSICNQNQESWLVKIILIGLISWFYKM